MRTPAEDAESQLRHTMDFRRGLFGSLSTRLRWSYALVSVVPLMLLGVGLIIASLRSHRERIAQEQQTTANWVAREIRSSLSAVDEQLLKLGKEAGPLQSTAEIQKAIDILTDTMPEIIDVAVLNEAGRERVHVSQLRGFYDSELIDRSDDELVRWTLETGRVAQGRITRQTDGILIYPSYAPILNNAGKTVGAIRVEVRSDRVARTLNEAPQAESSTAFLVNSAGKLLLDDEQTVQQTVSPALPSLLGRPLSHEEYANGAGVPVVGAWSMVPVQPDRWWVVVEIPRAVAYAPVQQDSLLLIGAVALVVLTTMGWGLYQARHILRPLEELREGAVTLGAGDLAARIPIHAQDEIGELAAEFNRMAEHLHTSRVEIEQQNERLRNGLALARDIQLGLLPSAPPGDMPQLAIQAHSVPAYEVGGDFYTYIALDEHRMAVAIGDISGKGVGAALMMALASSTVEAQGRSTTNPQQLLAALNRQLSARLTANHMNAALQYVIVDMEQSTLCVANAGMISPLVVRDGHMQIIEAYGLPLGSMVDARYTDITFKLVPGDLIVLVSDGIVEAHSPSGEMFGFNRLEETLSQPDIPLGPADLIALLLDRVTQFMAGQEQHDDMTIVVIQPMLSLTLDPVENFHVEEVAA